MQERRTVALTEKHPRSPRLCFCKSNANSPTHKIFEPLCQAVLAFLNFERGHKHPSPSKDAAHNSTRQAGKSEPKKTDRKGANRKRDAAGITAQEQKNNN